MVAAEEEAAAAVAPPAPPLLWLLRLLRLLRLLLLLLAGVDGRGGGGGGGVALNDRRHTQLAAAGTPRRVVVGGSTPAFALGGRGALDMRQVHTRRGDVPELRPLACWSVAGASGLQHRRGCVGSASRRK